MSWIQTHTGQQFYPLAPRPQDVRLADIAHALANKCRFGGHTRRFYSVAEHSVRVSALLAELGAPREAVIWGLMHDAAEAYLPDFARPVKGLFYGMVTWRAPAILTPEIQARMAKAQRLPDGTFAEMHPAVILEARVVVAITKALGLPVLAPNGEIGGLVNEADLVLLATEKRDLLRRDVDWHVELPRPLDSKIKSLMPVQAKVAFLDAARELGISEVAGVGDPEEEPA